MNFIKKVVNYLRETNNLLAWATILLAFFTWRLAYDTAALKEVDLGPDISLSDVNLEMVDDNGNVFKESSWLNGEQVNKGAVTSKVGHINVSLKLQNTGHIAGFVDSPTYWTSGSSTATTTKEFELVPAQRETGWIYPLDIAPIVEINRTIIINYKFKVYSSDLTKKDEFNISIKCEFPTNEFNAVNASCRPVKFSQ